MKQYSLMPRIVSPESRTSLVSPATSQGLLQKKKPLKPVHITTDQETLFLKDSYQPKQIGPSTVGSMRSSSIENNSKSSTNMFASMRSTPQNDSKQIKMSMARHSSQKSLTALDSLNQSMGVKLSRRQSIGRFSDSQILIDEIINAPDVIETEVNGKAARVCLEPIQVYKKKLGALNYSEYRKSADIEDPQNNTIKHYNSLLETLKTFKFIPKDKLSNLHPDDHDLIKKVDAILAESYTQKQDLIIEDFGIQENTWNTVELEDVKFTYVTFECRADNFPLKGKKLEPMRVSQKLRAIYHSPTANQAR